MKSQLAIGLIILVSGGVILGVNSSQYNNKENLTDMFLSENAYQHESVKEENEMATVEDTEYNTDYSDDTESAQETEQITTEQVSDEQETQVQTDSSQPATDSTGENQTSEDKKDNGLISESDISNAKSVELFGKIKAITDAEKMNIIKDKICSLNVEELSENEAKAVREKEKELYSTWALTFRDDIGEIVKGIYMTPYIDNEYYLQINANGKMYRIAEGEDVVQNIRDEIYEMFEEIQ